MLTAAILSLTTAVAPQGPTPREPAAWVDANLDRLEELYREFHRNPELSYFEKDTAERYAKQLEAAGAKVTRKVGGFGIVGEIGNGAGPTLMLRADLDGLPIVEQTGLDFASKVEVATTDGKKVGAMHACGHDIHMTHLLGAVQYLAANRDRWRGRLLVIGQPAEERGGGARAMLRAGLFRRFGKPDFALALHVHPLMRAGTVGYHSGWTMANVDSVDITLFGKGGHGAYPHMTIDPIVQAAQLVMQLQTIVSREVSPQEPAVITVGSIHGGTKHNIISDRCDLQLTVRSYTDEVRALLMEAIRRKAKAVAQAARAPEPKVEFSEHTPALFNDEKLVGRVKGAFERMLGKDSVVPAAPVMGGEDFSRYGRAGVPVFMFRLGTISAERLAAAENGGKPLPSLHSPFYWPSARATLRTGVLAQIAGALELLPR